MAALCYGIIWLIPHNTLHMGILAIQQYKIPAVLFRLGCQREKKIHLVKLQYLFKIKILHTLHSWTNGPLFCCWDYASNLMQPLCVKLRTTNTWSFLKILIYSLQTRGLHVLHVQHRFASYWALRSEKAFARLGAALSHQVLIVFVQHLLWVVLLLRFKYPLYYHCAVTPGQVENNRR